MVRVSPRPVGVLRICDRCPTRTFQNEREALAHADDTGHTVRPLLEVREE